jgi:ribosome-binding factor A
MPDQNRRNKQVANAIREELVKIAREDISDPRLEKVGMITFSGVELTSDLRNATVWVSFMGKEAKEPQVKEALKALESASGYMHRLLIKRIPMKMHPRLHFKFDNIFDRAATVNEALSEASALEKETSAYRKEIGDPVEGIQPVYRKKKGQPDPEEKDGE